MKVKFSKIIYRLVFFCIGLGIVALSYTVIQLLGASVQKPMIGEVPEEVVFPVRVSKVVASDIRPKRIFYGKAIARNQLELRSQVGGVVESYMKGFVSGSLVSKGEVIIQLDDFDYKNNAASQKISVEENKGSLSAIKAQIVQQKIQLKLEREQRDIAKKDFRRARKLFSSQTISARDLEARQKTLNNAAQLVNQTSSQLEQLEINERQQQNRIEKNYIDLENALRNIERTTIRAPFDSYIYEPKVEIGQQIGAGEKIVTLIDVSNADVEFTISDGLYGSIIAGGEKIVERQVEVVASYGGYEIRYEAEIIAVSPQISAQSGGIGVRARVYNKGANMVKPKLSSGSFVTIEVPDKMFSDVFEIKGTALYEDNVIYVVNQDNRLKAHDVEVQARSGDNIIVKSFSIVDGMEVAVSNFTEASEGVLVRKVQ